ATPEELTLASAQLRLARAQEQVVRRQLARTRVTAPAAGVVISRLVEPGEAILAGAPLLRLGHLAHLELVVYVPEPRLGDISLGQAVQVTVDPFPGRAFAGRVQAIAARPEYTPRNVATREERINTYYAVTVALEDAGGALKPGMPADAMFGSP
ncbi:MAG: HlyD family secretion protein, partial [Anaerolineae bacterium]